MSLVQLFDNNLTLTVGALASLDVISANGKIDGSRNQGFRVVKSEIFCVMEDKTVLEGPLVVGVACNAVAAEIEKAIEVDPQSPSDDDERGTGVFIMPIWMIGEQTIDIPLQANGRILEKTISYGKNGWSIPESEAWSVWCYNRSGAALTTGTLFKFFVSHFGVWLRD